MSITKKQYLFLAMLVLVSFLLIGCINKQVTNDGSKEQQGRVMINNHKRVIEFVTVPQRVVTLNQHATEIMLALGLSDKIVGAAHMDGEIQAEYKEQYNKIQVLSDRYPSKDTLLAVKPDFIYGYNDAFEDKWIGTVDVLEKQNIKSYITQGGLKEHATVQEVYNDINNIGKIFHVEAKAQDLIKNIKNEIQLVKEKTDIIDKRVKFMVIDAAAGNQVLIAGRSLESDLIRLAGGDNVFGNLEKSWGKTDWQEIIRRNPEVIVINEHAASSAQETIQMLVKNPALSEVEAIKKRRFVIFSFNDMNGGIRSGKTVQWLAKAFYPQLFQ
ncbi:iron complex transport system substrate-binding protein [Pelosinus fermentans]|uniref:ABC-type transporter, periplasmic subunit n=1 Tax=Pelosinus fermentans B4 TaxID=1149862 RepID=I9B1S4_9FIRM|nr:MULTISPECIES: ABC transporter substrate-binding protein [Pelosinus]EIW19102.1 ABC-type transporter, periplasmic subunit [Pelosinus fermentans B4]OAM95464.1 ABC-type transporter, periplasmic subunit [Pelosinus fermentans DSM 17108]SDR28398.1 iron complex transport system substrate-binding protein [Pelosinus fermentans]